MGLMRLMCALLTFDGNGGRGESASYLRRSPDKRCVLPRMPFFQRDNCSLDRYYNVTLSEVSQALFHHARDQDIVLRIDWSTDDFSFGGASPQFAGTTQWVRGVEVPESPTNGMGRNDDLGVVRHLSVQLQLVLGGIGFRI